MNKYNDDFIANAIIQSDYLINEEYKNIIEELYNKEHFIEPPTSDLDPFYTIRTHDNKIKLKASYIGDIITEDDNFFYLKWSWHLKCRIRFVFIIKNKKVQLFLVAAIKLKNMATNLTRDKALA